MLEPRTAARRPSERPAAIAFDPAERNVLWRAMQGLAQRQRAVLVLRYYLDLPDEEIATVLGCRRTSVRTLAARGTRGSHHAELRTALGVPDVPPGEDGKTFELIVGITSGPGGGQADHMRVFYTENNRAYYVDVYTTVAMYPTGAACQALAPVPGLSS